MAKNKNDDPDAEQLPADRDRDRHDPEVSLPIAGGPVKRPKSGDYPVEDPVPTPQTGETTRVLLTGDDRSVLTERYVPTTDNMFRIFADGQHFEHVAEGEGGVWIYAPTR
jgi:hypothetical protein